MLGRLMKYEFKSTYREFLGIYCALIISTLLTWMVDLPQLEVVGYIASICVFAVIVAAIVIMLMSILGAFNKRVYGREGYLNMTLPATVHQQVLARLFVSVIWCLITIIVMILSFLLLLQIHGGIFTQEILLPQVMDLLKALWENNVILTIILLIGCGLASIFGMVLSLYSASAVAHLPFCRRWKVLAGIGTLFVFAIVESRILWLIAYASTGWVEDIGQRFSNGVPTEMVPEYVGYINLAIGVFLLLAVIFAVAKYFLTTYLLSRHMELE